MSQAREAQESLAFLEKSNAPIVQQVEQAALFGGISPSNLKSLTPTAKGDGVLDTLALAGRDHHGRREWSLRWLLKKLQDEARRCPDAWRLLRWLVQGVPARGVARVLNERNFIAIVRQSLEEEVTERRRLSMLVPTAVPDIVSDSMETAQSSLARERDGEPKTGQEDCEMVEGDDGILGSTERDTQLTKAIHDAIKCVVSFSAPKAPDGEERNEETFIVEYMKAVIRTTNDEAAKILGAWLELCITPGTDSRIASWLSPFMEIWSSHIAEANDTVVFANHCLRPLLVLLSRVDQFPEWKSMLEQLLARYFVIPAKSAYVTSSNTDLLSILVGESISIEPLFAPVLFDVAIRSLRPCGARLRHQQDAAWLVAIFMALEDAIIASISANKNLAICRMLRSCLDYQVRLDLVPLRGLVVEFALSEHKTDWHILAMAIRLDSNVFLITRDSEQALTKLLNRFTMASLEPPWPGDATQVVDDVLVPLMGEFAKARDLAGFVHHWYKQVDELRLSKLSKYFHAWEDEALHVKMRDIMEMSMTTQQIVEVFQWTRNNIEECPNAAFVVLDAISGAVTRDETINALTLEYWELIQSNSDYLWREERFSRRLWRITNRVARWQPSNNDREASDGCAGTRENFAAILCKYISPPARDTEQIRCACRWWTEFSDSCNSNSRMEILLWLRDIIILDVGGSCIKLEEGLKTDPTILGDERWGDRTTKIEKGAGWSACSLVNMILVEYPRVLELVPTEPGPTGRELFRNIIWLASATTPFTSVHCKVPWLRMNHDVFPSMWTRMLQNDSVLNNSEIMGRLMNAMLDCADHTHNPIEQSRACNGFVINCLHKLPLEVFSRSNRGFILKAWQPESPDPAHYDIEALSYKLTTTDPAVLSLKVRMMQRPTLYDGIKFQDLVNLAEHLVLLSPKPKVVLPIFAELARLTLCHVVATMDQPRSRDYISEVVPTLVNWLQKYSKAKAVPPYAMIRLFQVVVSALGAKLSLVDTTDNPSKQSEAGIASSFKDLLLSNLRHRLQKPEELKDDDCNLCMSLYSTMDALDALGVSKDDLVDLQAHMEQALIPLREFNTVLKMRLETFITEYYPKRLDVIPSILLRGDPSSPLGRWSIQKKVQAVTRSMSETERLQLVNALLHDGYTDSNGLDKLLALRYAIANCEASQDTQMSNDGLATASLSSVYSTLASHLCKTSSVRRFYLISETMEFILRVKPRAVTQYNIDTTLSSITTLCSRHSPSLPVCRAGTIYSHLTRLLYSILTNHRVKLRGHFHLLLQTLQALLHCLFVPLYAPVANSSTSTSASTSASQSTSFPLWLYASARKITPAHASAFTKLVTLICNPSPTAANQITNTSQPSSHLPLTSASKAAQHLAAQHMPLLLAAYIRWTLDLRLRLPPDIKEKLMPGWWAVLDTMTIDGRRLLGEMMDSNGRAVLHGLVGDWTKWGRWKGN